MQNSPARFFHLNDRGDMETLPPLSFWGLLNQGRGLLELPRLLWHWPRLLRSPRGSGAPVITLPGYGTDDGSMFLLRYYLRRLGYQPQRWGIGRNSGDAPTLLPRIMAKVELVAQSFGRRISLIGWSMGGYLAREAAREHPQHVRQVITLGTPVVGGPKYTRVATDFRNRGYDLEAIEAEVEARARVPLQAPVLAIYSKSDGVVAWQACIDRKSPTVKHVEVETTHLGLGFSPEVYRLIAIHMAGHHDI